MVEYMEDGVFLWQKNALCAGIDSSIFFNDEDKNHNNDKDTYKGICGRCPVRGECLEYALLYNMSGIWGGMTEKERFKLYSRDYLSILRDDAIESGTYNFTLKA